MRTDPHHQNNRIILFLLALTLIIGILLTGWSVHREHKQMLERLLFEAGMVSNSVNWRFVQQLSGDENDLELSEYQQLKQQLTLIRSAHPTCRFIYLLGQREDGEIFFFLDSEPPESEEYSPPGQAYPEATELLKHVFATGIEATEGPVSDRWGNWVSALIPLKDHETKALVGLLGMDIDAERWNWQLFQAGMIPGSITLFLIIIGITLYILRRKTQLENMKLIRSEAILRESEARYRQLVDHAPAGIYEVDLTNRRFISVNDIMSKYSGYSKEELLTMDPMALLSESSQTLFRERLERIFKGEEIPSTTEFNIRTKDNNEFRVLLNAQYFIEEGKPVRASVVVYDITELKKAQEALRTNELRFRMIIQNARAVIFILDPEGKFVLSEGLALEKLGLKPGQVVGLSSLEMYREYPDVINAVEKTLKGEEQRVILDIQGTVFDTLFSPVFDQDNKLLNVIGIATDISDLKQTEKELILAKDKAEESDRLKSAFLANMSHEIRTPMNGIVGFAELLRDPDFSSEEKNHFIDIINKNAHNLLSIIQDIVDISKIEAGQEQVNPDGVDLNQVLEELFEFFQPQAAEKKLVLSIMDRLDSEQARVITDRNKLRQILTNLISNAIKFTEQGEIAISLRKEGGKLFFSVKDTGRGIAPEYHGIVFDRFGQAPASPESVQRGTGLGLAISRAYAGMLGGSISLESSPGSGSVFTLDLPFKPAGILTSDHRTVQQNPAAGKPDWTGKTFLLVEDEEDNAMYFQELLKATCARVWWAKTGKEAISMFREHPGTDVVIMDIKLPEMDGLEATRILKSLRQDVPIIATTAFALSGDRERCLEAGCDDYFAKPVRAAAFLSLLTKYLGSP